jgi:hypothetical protein
MSSTVGLILSIRVMSVTRPPSIGTLMSTRTSTVFPARSMSSSVFQGIAVLHPSGPPAFGAGITPTSTAYRFALPLGGTRRYGRARPKTKETPMADIKDPENTIILTLKDGEVVIELLRRRGAETCRAHEAACPRQGL